MNIYKLNLEDLAKIKDNLQDEFDDFWNINILEQEIQKNECKYIVAKNEKNEILGFAGVFLNIDIAEIMNIVVKKNSRQKGIGKQLLNELIAIVKQTKLKIVNLEVNCKNFPAISLYEKCGFKKIGVRKKYYNNIDDAIIMQKYL